MSEIIPAILATTQTDLDSKLAQIPKEVKFAHIDVLEQDVWSDNVRIPFEAHLMVTLPEEIMERWVKRGAKRIIVHKLNEVIKAYRGRVEIGLGVELHIPLEEIFPLIPEVDFVHLMSIAEIGGQGRPMDVAIFDRIRLVKEKFPQTVISLDGGIKVTNYRALEEAGVDRLVVGSDFKNLWNSLTKK